ncbi:MAG TPA: hypothetical protein VFX30_07530, partial [bacterium]|nr:hypothetical protein [bacterium]
MGSNHIVFSPETILNLIREAEGPEAAAKAALEFAERNNAASAAKTIIQPAVEFVRSAPPPSAPPAPPVNFVSPSGRMFLQVQPAQYREAFLQAARAAVNNPTVQKTAVGTGTGATAATGFAGTVGAVFGAESLGAIGSMGGAAIGVAAGAVVVAGAVGVGIGVGLDYLTGALSDNGRTLSD